MRTLPLAATQPEPIRRSRSAAQRYWGALRLGTLVACLGIGLTALYTPAVGLMLFWQVVIPLAPLMFLLVPGLWRNICPMATLNGLPGHRGWSRGWRLPVRLQRAAPAVSACLFFAIIPLRKVFLDQSGVATAAFLLLLLVLALAMGMLFSGKGGWCSHFCPMGPVERLYGHSPLLVIHDTHCRSCVGCARHCYDLNPTRAHLSEVYGGDRGLRMARLAFAGAMPWLCVAFFTQPALSSHPSAGAIMVLCGRMWLLAAVGAGLSLVLQSCPGLSPQSVIRAHAIVALNLYCLFALPTGWPHDGRLLLLQSIGVALFSGIWLWAAARRERAFLTHRFFAQMRLRLRAPATTSA